VDSTTIRVLFLAERAGVFDAIDRSLLKRRLSENVPSACGPSRCPEI